jgi:CRISPR-associated protein Cmr1
MADTQVGVALAAAPATGEDRGSQDVAAQTRELERLRAGEHPLADLAAMRATAHAARARQAQTLVLELTTITPVYGGGTRPGEVDLLVPFRPRAIKNGIRHWWWLLNRHAPEYRITPADDADARMAKKQALYDAMVHIWGGAAREGEKLAAKVSVEVSGVKPSQLVPYSAYKITTKRGLELTEDSSAPWLYALFGARGVSTPRPDRNAVERIGPWEPSGQTLGQRYGPPQPKGQRWTAADLANAEALFDTDEATGRRKMPHWLMLPGASFKLTLQMSPSLGPADLKGILTSEQIAQVETALAFWLVFGGLGARTSRGLGRLRVAQGSFDAWQKINAAAQQSKGFAIASAGGALTSNEFLRGEDFRTPERSMLWLLGAYKGFRQSRPDDEAADRGEWHWQKADIVRRVLSGAPSHTGASSRDEAAGKWSLPELLFGAPIVVSFQGKDKPLGQVELTFAEPSGADGKPGQAKNRYASPIFFGLREVALPGSVVWQPCVLQLNALRDFSGQRLQVRIKRNGPNGQILKDIPAGQWWADFDAADMAAQQSRLLSAFGSMPKPKGAATMIGVFLDQVRRGQSKP